MKRFRKVYHLLCLVLLFGVLGGLCGGQVVFAAQESSDNSSLLPPSAEQPAPEETVEIVTPFPVLPVESGESFEFLAQIAYEGSEPKIFELSVTVPPGWEAIIEPHYKLVKEAVLAIRETPGNPLPEKLDIVVSPLPGNQPEIGEYVFTLEAASGDLKDSIELKGVVTDIPLTYELDMVTTGRLDILAKAGEENHIAIKLTNSGIGILEDITLSSIKSEGWGITFTPSKVESLDPGLSQEVDVVITPPRRTIAGDHRITLSAWGSEGSSDSIALRVRVQTPTVWGGAGIGIIAAVIAGLTVLFRRLGRR